MRSWAMVVGVGIITISILWIIMEDDPPDGISLDTAPPPLALLAIGVGIMLMALGWLL